MIVDISVPPVRAYNELVPMGRIRSSFLKKLSEQPMSDKLTLTILSKYLPDEFAILQEQVEGKFFYVIPNASAIHKSEMKLDEKRPWPLSDQSKMLALAYVDQVLEAPLTHDMWTDEQTIQHISNHGTLDKAAGVPMAYLPHIFMKVKNHNLRNFMTRRNFVESRWWQLNKENYSAIVALGMVYMSAPKKEYASISDLYEEKARTYLISGFHVLYWQLRLFGQGNENLKNFLWSKYGFNPFTGNANRLAERILQKSNDVFIRPVRFTWDVSGYDRKVDLSHVADRRYRCFKNVAANNKFLDFAKWVTDGLKVSILILLNGDVVMRKRGNNSGSGMTTANNIEAGFEILADILIAAYFVKFGEYPTRDLVFDQLIMLYGDDNMACVVAEFDYLLNREWLQDRLLRFHGLVLKTFSGGYQHPLGDLPFLGFTFSKYFDYYIPKWDKDRLVLPLVYRVQHYTIAQYCQQFYSVLLLSFAHLDLWLFLRTVYIKLLNKLSSIDGSPDFKSMLMMGAPTQLQMATWYLGLEAWKEDGPRENHVMANFSLESEIRDLVTRTKTASAVEALILVATEHRGFIYNNKENTWTDKLNELFFREGWQRPSYEIKLVPGRTSEYDDQYRVTADINTPIAHVEFQPTFHVDMQGSIEKQNYQVYWYLIGKMYKLPEVRKMSGDDIELLALEYLSTLIIDYFAQPFRARVRHELAQMVSECVGDPKVLARLALKFKEGGFNPYGNAQMDVNPGGHRERGEIKLHYRDYRDRFRYNDAPCQFDRIQDINIPRMTSFSPILREPKNSFVRQIDLEYEKAGGSFAYGNKNRDFFFAALVYKLSGGSLAFGNRNKRMTFKKFAAKNPGIAEGELKRMWEVKASLRNLPKIKVKNPPRKTKNPRQRLDPTRTTNKTIKGDLQRGIYGSTQPMTMQHPVGPVGTKMQMSECAARWALWLTDPFVYFRRTAKGKWEKQYEAIIRDLVMLLPCIPSFPALPTYKFVAISKGSFQTNTAGSGFILFSPFRPASNYITAGVGADSQCPILVSTGSYVNPALPTFPVCDQNAAPVAGLQPINWQTPFSVASITNSTTYFRNTFAGLQISYSGALLNTSGDYFHVHDGGHATVSGQIVDNYSQYPGYYTEPITKGRWSKQIWCYALHPEFDFKGDIFFGGAANTFVADPLQANHAMGIYIYGATNGGTVASVFRYEVIAGFEAFGYGINQTKTANASDAVGLDIVTTHVNPDTTRALNTQPSLVQAMFESPTVTQAMKKVGVKVFEFAADTAVGWIGSQMSGSVAPPRLMAPQSVTVTEVDDEEEGLHNLKATQPEIHDDPNYEHTHPMQSGGYSDAPRTRDELRRGTPKSSQPLSRQEVAMRLGGGGTKEFYDQAYADYLAGKHVGGQMYGVDGYHPTSTDTQPSGETKTATVRRTATGP